jgi:DNA-binding NarL/FixJ family response regulator
VKKNTAMKATRGAVSEAGAVQQRPADKPPADKPEDQTVRIRVLVIEDQSQARDALLRTLASQDDIELAGLADSPVTAAEQIRKSRADVALLGWPASSPQSQRIFALIQESKATTRVIMMAADDKQEDFVEAVRQGCCGIVPRQTPAHMLLKSIRKVFAGEFWLDRITTAEVIRKLAKKSPAASQRTGVREQSAALSQREREIVNLVAQGFKNKEMAERMFISEQTVKNHLHNVFDKLGVSDRLELALYAIHHNLHDN